MVMYSVVVPVYNEKEVIAESYKRLTEVMRAEGESYELIFVDDGSRDTTLTQLKELAGRDACVRILSFSRNFGHQIAVTAGLDHASGQAVVLIDADLQDPPEVMTQMFAKWREGYQVVYGKRLQRQGETFFKKLTAKLFYRTLNAMTDIELPVDAGDFRLLDRKVVDALKSLPEHNRYVRGLVAWVGFRQTYVEYVRHERFAGESKYPLRKMIRLATDGMTSFSQRPLKLGTGIGVLFCVAAVGIALWQLISGLTGNLWSEMACWAALLLFAQGVVLICTGVQGGYLARMYDEAKGRPHYLLSERIGFSEEP